MVEYKCLRCGYVNIRRGRFILHLKRKFICPAKLQNISIVDVYKYYFNNENNELTQKTLNLPQNDSKSLKNPSIFPQFPSISLINCQYCNRSFKRKDNMKRHHETCKAKKNNEITDEIFQEKLQLAINEMTKSGQLIKVEQPLAKLGSVQV